MAKPYWGEIGFSLLMAPWLLPLFLYGSVLSLTDYKVDSSVFGLLMIGLGIAIFVHQLNSLDRRFIRLTNDEMQYGWFRQRSVRIDRITNVSPIFRKGFLLSKKSSGKVIGFRIHVRDTGVIEFPKVINSSDGDILLMKILEKADSTRKCGA